MPAEAYKLSHESFNRVIYNSARLTSFKEEKQMAAMHGNEKPTGRALSAQTLSHHLLYTSFHIPIHIL